MSHIAWQILAYVAAARQQELRAEAKAHATWWEARRLRRKAVRAQREACAPRERSGTKSHGESGR